MIVLSGGDCSFQLPYDIPSIFGNLQSITVFAVKVPLASELKRQGMTFYFQTTACMDNIIGL